MATEQLTYSYIAYDESGAVVRGKLLATSEDAVSELLDNAGYQVVSVKRFVPFVSLGKLSLGGLSRVKPTELILFYRQLALLIESGIDIVTSLGLLRSQASSRALDRVLGEVMADLRGGSQFSVALGKHPAIFPAICCQSLRVGEQTGNLEVMLRQVADYMEKANITAKSIKNALMMPIITAVVAIGVIGLLITVVLPAFGNLYSSLGVDLPLMTRILLGLAGYFQSYGLYLFLVALILGAAGFAYIKTPQGRYNLDKLLLKLPILGRVIHLNELARCCRSISLLFRAGLPLTEILPLAIQGSGNRVVSEALTQVQREMIQGEGLSRPMARDPLFLPMMVQMVRVGEETGNLDNSLLSVAQNYESDAEDRTSSLIGLVQPVMTLGIAIVVGLIALSMVSAMYSLYGQAF